MTKRDVIYKAYLDLDVSDEVYTHINEDGWISNEDLLITRAGVYIGDVEYKQVGHPFTVLPANHKSCMWRPKSLKGLENNNGWTKIEGDDSLPTEVKTIEVLEIVGGGFNRVHFSNDRQCLGYYKRLYSHWREEVKDKRPHY